MISIVVPVYNEEDSISLVLDQLLEEKKRLLMRKDKSSMEIIVVDDASNDKTADILKTYQDILVIKQSVRQGYGKALKTGFRAARGEWIFFLDGDGTYQALEWISFYERQKSTSADMVVGSRFMKSGGKMPLIRRFGNQLFVFLISRLTGRYLTDVTSGMRLIKKKVLLSLYPLPDGLNFTLAMTLKALQKNIHIEEVAITYHSRLGYSKLNVLKDGIQFLVTIFKNILLIKQK
jgi:glycosyltransferase involved in cell wall biosynthesis